MCLNLGPVISSYTVEDRIQNVDSGDLDIPPEDEEEEENDDVEEDIGPIGNCFACERDENDTLLLFCDRCPRPYHTYCLGLDSVPRGEWCCPPCESDKNSLNAPMTITQIPDRNRPILRTGRERREARAAIERRRNRIRNQQWTVAISVPPRLSRPRRRNDSQNWQWTSAWQSVLADLNSDVNPDILFPEHGTEEVERQSREFHELSRRLEVAHRQGNGQQLTEAVPYLLTQPIRQQTKEEINSWEMLDEAERLQNPESVSPSSSTNNETTTQQPKGSRSDFSSDRSTDNCTLSLENTPKRLRSQADDSLCISPEPDRKRSRRGSRSSSVVMQDDFGPSDQAVSQPERKLKRPMTRRVIQPRNNDKNDGLAAGAASSAAANIVKVESLGENGSGTIENEISPSLLESLLKDINKPKPVSTLDRALLSQFSTSALSPGFETSIITPAPSPPRMASPILSDRYNDHTVVEPYSRSPIIQSTMSFRRQGSPRRLGKDPAHHRAAESNHYSSPLIMSETNESSSSSPNLQESPSTSPQDSPKLPPVYLSSPPPLIVQLSTPAERASFASSIPLALSTKSDIEKMVRAALKPHYRPGGISKEDFAKINQLISRKMYTMVTETGRIKEWEKTKWQKVAEDEVQKEVNELVGISVS